MNERKDIVNDAALDPRKKAIDKAMAKDLNSLAPPTREEAYAMDQRSNLWDLVNGHVDLLRCLAERIPPDQEDPVQGNLKNFLLRQAEKLIELRSRMDQDHDEYIGLDRHAELMVLWGATHISFQKTWKNNRLSDCDGNFL